MTGIVIDANVWIAAASRYGCVAELIAGIRNENAPVELRLVAALRAGRFPGVTVACGEHIWWNVRDKLTRRYGWSDAEACAWVRACRAIAADADVDASVSPSELVKLQVVCGVEDHEDAMVVAMARAAGASIIVTNDKPFQRASVPGVRVASIMDFVSEHRPVLASAV